MVIARQIIYKIISYFKLHIILFMYTGTQTYIYIKSILHLVS